MSHFGLSRRQKMCTQCLPTPLNEASRPRPVCNLFRRGVRKWNRRAMWPLDTSFTRNCRSCFLAGQEAKNDFAWPVDSLRYRFLDLAHVEFWAGQKTENKFGGLVDPLENNSLDLAKVPMNCALHDSAFVESSRTKCRKMSSKVHSIPWTLDFTTRHKTYFQVTTNQKRSYSSLGPHELWVSRLGTDTYSGRQKAQRVLKEPMSPCNVCFTTRTFRPQNAVNAIKRACFPLNCFSRLE